VNGYFELCKVDFKKFYLVYPLVGVVLKFCQRISAFDITHQHRPYVNCLVENAIITFMELAHHHPT